MIKPLVFTYDGLSRLTAAEPFSSTSPLHTDWSTEKGITYDRNSNILTLTRTGSSGAVSQSYRFEYVGNQRKKTMNGSGVYTYDANGNMTEDALTGCGISYNLLNLPEDLQDHWGSGEISHRYSYLADGMKKTVGERAKVKASGGIRTPEAAKALVEAGADRIGAGNGIVLL